MFTLNQLATISMQKELGLSGSMGLACSLNIHPVSPFSPLHEPEEEKSMHGVPDIIISGITCSCQFTSHVPLSGAGKVTPHGALAFTFLRAPHQDEAGSYRRERVKAAP